MTQVSTSTQQFSTVEFQGNYAILCFFYRDTKIDWEFTTEDEKKLLTVNPKINNHKKEVV